jgi:hypothetical protein
MFHNNPAGEVLLKGKDQYGHNLLNHIINGFQDWKKNYLKTSYFDEGYSRTEPSP